MKKRLMKSSTDKHLSGVLGGIAEYFGWDSSWVRIGYAVLTLFTSGFPGILLYIVMAIIMPKNEGENNADTQTEEYQK